MGIWGSSAHALWTLWDQHSAIQAVKSDHVITEFHADLGVQADTFEYVNTEPVIARTGSAQEEWIRKTV